MGEMSMKNFMSDVEPHNHGGESEEHLAVVNQQRHMERRKNDMKAFSRELIAEIMDADELVIFGPGTAKHDLHHEVEDHKVLNEKLKGVETTDELTEAEMKDFVKNYFKLPRA